MKKKPVMKESARKRLEVGANIKRPEKPKKAESKINTKQVNRTAGVLNAGQKMKVQERKRGRRHQTEGFFKKYMLELKAIVNSSPIPQFAIGQNHRILYWNRALEAISGIKAEDVIGTKQQWLAFYGKRRPTLADLLIEGDIKGISYWYGSKCGKSKYVAEAYEGTDYFPKLGQKGRWLFFTAALIKDAAGTIIGANETLKDITDQKLAELKLRESEERFSQIAESTEEWIWEVNSEGLYTYTNAVVKEILGYKPEEIVGEKHFYDFFPSDSREKSKKEAFEYFTAKKAFFKYINFNMHKNGSKILLETSGIPILNSKGRLLGYRGADTNITEQKRAEDALREHEERFRQLVENAGEIIVVAQNNMLKYVNPMTTKVTGFSEKELYARRFLDFIHPEDRDLVAERYKQRISGAEPPSVYQFRLMNKDGSVRWVEINGVRITWDKSPATLNFIKDITARRLAEEALKVSEEKYRTLVDNMHDAVYRCDLNGNLVFTTPSAARLLGCSSVEEMIGLIVTDFYYSPKEAEKQYEILKKEGKLTHYEVMLKRRDTGEPVIVLANIQFYRDRDGNIIGIEGVYSDITERKRAEEALRVSENEYRELVENANSIILRMDTRGTVTFFNEFAQKFFGYTSSEIMGKNVVGTILPETDSSGQDMGRFIRDIAKNPEKYKNNENENIKKSGERVWVSWTNKIIQDKKGKVKEILCIGNDITGHKKWEDALRQSEIKFRELADFLPEIVFELDINGKVTYVNRVAFTLLGYSPDDLGRGINMFDVILPLDRDRVRNNFKDLLDGRITGGHEYLMLKKDQSMIPVIIHSRAIKPGGAITGVRGIIVDISDRKKAENSLRESEEKFRRLFEDSGIAQFLLDGHRIIDCNIEAMNMMGCREKNQLCQKLFYDFCPEIQQDGESSKVKGAKYIKLAVQKRSITFEWQYCRLDGELLMVEVVMTAIPTSGKDILHVNVRDITERKRLQNEIINIIDVEQQRLGQNLHDGLGQDLTGVAFMCNTLTKKLKDTGLPEAAMSEEITSLVYHVITRVRMLSRELYPPNLVENEITYTLQQFATNISSMFGISCTFVQDPDLVISDIFISTQIYYIVREAVNNSIKHGHANQIIISLTHNKNDAVLVIEDDGIGRPENMDKYKGLGLRIMAYRMGTMNGTFAIFDNYKSRGVIVFCTLPVYKLKRDH